MRPSRIHDFFVALAQSAKSPLKKQQTVASEPFYVIVQTIDRGSVSQVHRRVIREYFHGIGFLHCSAYR